MSRALASEARDYSYVRPSIYICRSWSASIFAADAGGTSDTSCITTGRTYAIRHLALCNFKHAIIFATFLFYTTKLKRFRCFLHDLRQPKAIVTMYNYTYTAWLYPLTNLLWPYFRYFLSSSTQNTVLQSNTSRNKSPRVIGTVWNTSCRAGR